ncbi:MAG: serine/threonine protein kinase [Myxococcales bacterium]|nr:serine/threonine protein kinase [Myxococcales bacterium]
MARTPPLGSNSPAPVQDPSGLGTQRTTLGQASPPPSSGPQPSGHAAAARTMGPEDSIIRGGTIRPPGESPGPPAISPYSSSPMVPLGELRGSRASISASQPDTILPKFCPECLIRYPAEFRVCPKDASELLDAENEDHDELVGRTLSDTYAIVRAIGEGGMGRVYEARHTRIGTKRFALKMLHPEYARQAEVLSRFQREAEAAASIRSPYVGDVYDIGRTADGRPFIVAEYLEGEELANFLRARGKLSVDVAVRIVRQICKALSAAHAKGIVHRDMKPENVFLVGDLSSPTAKVIDFGISKVHDSGAQSLTKTGMIMGTPSYMAPEQARGERVDHRVDIYAVGAILYELVTGKRPFDRPDPTATLTAVLLEEPERPCTLNPNIPESLEMLIQRAMAKRPEDRYASMDDFEAELAAFAEHAGGGAPTTMSPPRLHQPSDPRGSRVAIDERQRDVSVSRPTIALMGALATFGVLAGLLTVGAAVIRLTRGGTAAANVTGSEALLLGLMMTLALATPLGFAVHWVRKNVWKNSAKTVELATNMRRVVVSAFVTYGVAALTVHLVEAVVLRRAAGVAWPVWDLVAFAFAGVAAGITYLAFRR